MERKIIGVEKDTSKKMNLNHKIYAMIETLLIKLLILHKEFLTV